jgi:hypothetical protein
MHSSQDSGREGEAGEFFKFLAGKKHSHVTTVQLDRAVARTNESLQASCRRDSIYSNLSSGIVIVAAPFQFLV